MAKDSVNLTLTYDEAQTLYDLIWYGISGSPDGRYRHIDKIYWALVQAGVARSRQDFQGRIDIDSPSALPGICPCNNCTKGGLG